MRNPHILKRLKYNMGGYSYKKHKHNKQNRVLKFKLIIFTIITALILYTSFNFIQQRMSFVALSLCEAELKNKLYLSCNEKISEILQTKNLTSSDLIEKEYTDKNLKSLTVSLNKLNLLKGDISTELTKIFENQKSFTCYVPIGALVSDKMFSAYGFKLPVKMMTSAYGGISFDDDFTSVGINQTKYRLMLTVNITSVIHTASENISSSSQIHIPVTEAIISGDVPVYGIDGYSASKNLKDSEYLKDSKNLKDSKKPQNSK